MELEDVKCCFCNSDSSKLFDQVGSWKVKECYCGHIYTSPRPKMEFLARLYDEEYYGNNDRFNGEFSKGKVGKSDSDFYKNIQDVESWVEQRGSLLEIGCAKGDFLKAMSNRGWKVVGVDISEESIGRGLKENELDLRCGTIETVEFSKKFDAIVMYQCLEHMPNAKLALDRSYELLNKDGVLVIEVPNLKSFDFKISKKRRFWSYDLPYHLSHFTPSFLSQELKKRNFTILEIDLYYPNFILSLLKGVNKMKGSKEVSEPIQRTSNSELKKSIKLSKKNNGIKIKMLNFISKFFPGWRFTIIAKK